MSAADDLGISSSPSPDKPVAAAKSSGGGASADLGIHPDWKPNIAGAANKLARNVGKWTEKHVAKPISGAIKYGHAHPIDATMNVLGAPQRGLEALETGENVGKAIMDPKMAKSLSRAVKKKIGLQGLEDTALAGSDLPHKLARGALDTGLDIVNDPLTFAPIGKGAELLGKGIKAIPKVGAAVDAATKAVKGSKAFQGAADVVYPDAYLRGLTPDAKNTFEKITNRAMENVRKRKAAEDAIVAKYADQIRAGQMPRQVEALFGGPHGWQQYFLDPKTGRSTFKAGIRPQDVQEALFRHRAPLFKEQAMAELKKAGFFKSGSFGAHAGPGGHFEFPSGLNGPERAHYIDSVHKDLERSLEPAKAANNKYVEMGLKAARGLTHRGNQAFLANPLPHTGNLASLAYNRYGLPTLAKGVVNAGRVAFGKTGGKLGSDIQELEDLGAHSQYGNIFDELGLTRIAGIKGTEGAARLANKVIVPLEKASNKLQHKVLNSTETGLRAAALNAEKRAGKTGAAAARNIHSTFGTDAPNAITQGARSLAEPFAKFHLQTAPGSVLRTLATNPGRIASALKSERDMNAQVNPRGPKYYSSVPGAASARMLADPLGYATGNLGPIMGLLSPYGELSKLKQGKIGEALGNVGGKFVPQAATIQAIIEMARHKKGSAKQSGLQDLASSLVGGYYK